MINIFRKEGLIFNQHFGSRQGKAVKYVVIHATQSSTFEAAYQELRNSSGSKGKSYHYIVEGKNIWEIVNPQFAAYHAGDINMNRESLGVAHVAIQGEEVNDDIYPTSGQFIADFLRANGLLPTRDVVKTHREVRPKTLVFWGGKPQWVPSTECPGMPGKLGSLDMDRLMGEIVKFYYGVSTPEVITPQPSPQPVENPAFPKTVVTTVAVRRRQEPNTQSPIYGVVAGNTSLTIIAQVEGESIQNNNIWYNMGDGYIWSGATK